MPRKSTTASAKRQRPPRSRIETPTPAQRLAALEARAAARGYRPMTRAEFDRFLEQHRDLWPEPGEIDAFVAWLHRGRHNATDYVAVDGLSILTAP